MKEIDEIMASDLPQVEKIARAFHTVLRFYEETGKQELELMRMLGDEEKYVRTQVKLSTLEHAAAVFDHCYLLVMGKKVWNEQDKG